MYYRGACLVVLVLALQVRLYGQLQAFDLDHPGFGHSQSGGVVEAPICTTMQKTREQKKRTRRLMKIGEKRPSYHSAATL